MTTKPDTSRPVVLRCETTSDFLATLPYLMGYTVRNSLVVSLFEGTRARQAMRVDLPDPAMKLADTGLDSAVIRLVRRFPAVTSVALVIYTDEPFSPSGTAPRLMLARWLERSLASQGYAVEDVCCVASNAWASLLTSDALTGGRPLEDLLASTARLDASEHVDGPLTALGELGELPPRTPGTAGALRRALASIPATGRVDLQGLSDHDVRNRLNTCIRALVTVPGESRASAGLPPPTRNGTHLHATLVQTAENGVLWILAVLACFFVQRREAQVSRRVAGELRSAIVSSMQPFERDLAARLKLMSAERMNAVDLRRMIANLTVLAANTPVARRNGLLRLLAWAWWMNGLTTPAVKTLASVRGEQARHPVDVALEQVFASGPPLWMYDSNEKT